MVVGSQSLSIPPQTDSSVLDKRFELEAGALIGAVKQCFLMGLAFG
jgi:hypothetical protein